ncbi:hypothetical protein [Aureisphaera galaxeae]|uniref:hypothetical protein n=1 Tax=Aureisphaera galaxeae TaxID=1538023 RepID=UPI002350385D|nr:hypothetical protein [Aureisphaera galaxeae]
MGTIICALLIAACGVKPYNQEQYAQCFTNYSNAFNACGGNDSCEEDALADYQECTGEHLKLPVHFVVLTNKFKDSLATQLSKGKLGQIGGPLNPKPKGGTKKVTKTELIDYLKSEVDTLNRYFTVYDASLPPDNRRKLVTFEYKSATLFGGASNIDDPLTDFAIPVFDFDKRHSDFKPAVNTTTEVKLYDPNAVNVYIVDCVEYESDGSLNDINSSHGKNNCDKPYIVLDYKRILGLVNRQGAEEHEMGHAFGLAHVCDNSANNVNDDTNIMASSGSYLANGSVRNNEESECRVTTIESIDCTANSGGNRSVGFTTDQCIVILEKVNEFLDAIN